MNHDSYAVFDTENKEFHFAKLLRRFYTVELFIIGLTVLGVAIAVIDLLSKGNSLTVASDGSDDSPILIVGGVIGVFLLSLGLRTALSVGIKRQMNKLIIGIAITTFVIHSIIFGFMITHHIQNFGSPIQSIGGMIIIIFFLIYSIGAFNESRRVMPGTSFFERGDIVINNVKTWEIPTIAAIMHPYYASLNGYAVQTSDDHILEQIYELGLTFRVARVDGEIVGFIGMRYDYKRIADLFIVDKENADKIERYLALDFARLYVGSRNPVFNIKLPARFNAIHEKLSIYGWELTSENKKSKTFKYVG